MLVLELGFRPHVDLTEPYGLDMEKTVPSIRHLNDIWRPFQFRRLGLSVGVSSAMTQSVREENANRIFQVKAVEVCDVLKE